MRNQQFVLYSKFICWGS